MDAVSAELLTRAASLVFALAFTFGIASLVTNIVRFVYEFLGKLHDEQDV